jgi:hypothetical protein
MVQAVGSWEYAEAIERDIWRSQALYEPVMTAYADPDDAPDLMVRTACAYSGNAGQRGIQRAHCFVVLDSTSPAF